MIRIQIFRVIERLQSEVRVGEIRVGGLGSIADAAVVGAVEGALGIGLGLIVEFPLQAHEVGPGFERGLAAFFIQRGKAEGREGQGGVVSGERFLSVNAPILLLDREQVGHSQFPRIGQFVRPTGGIRENTHERQGGDGGLGSGHGGISPGTGGLLLGEEVGETFLHRGVDFIFQ